jgi:signal transduction histidine kinase
VTLSVVGRPRPLPVGVDLSAYRIVQEALTNVLKHAGRTASATVGVHYREDAVALVVSDDGDSDAPPGSGRGLINMRERVQLFGGTFRAGPAPGQGYAVTAVLPTGSS